MELREFLRKNETNKEDYYIFTKEDDLIASGTCRQLYLFLGMYVLKKK